MLDVLARPRSRDRAILESHLTTDHYYLLARQRAALSDRLRDAITVAWEQALADADVHGWYPTWVKDARGYHFYLSKEPDDFGDIAMFGAFPLPGPNDNMSEAVNYARWIDRAEWVVKRLRESQS